MENLMRSRTLFASALLIPLMSHPGHSKVQTCGDPSLDIPVHSVWTTVPVGPTTTDTAFDSLPGGNLQFTAGGIERCVVVHLSTSVVAGGGTVQVRIAKPNNEEAIPGVVQLSPGTNSYEFIYPRARPGERIRLELQWRSVTGESVQLFNTVIRAEY
jgi:hypothetical protein